MAAGLVAAGFALGAVINAPIAAYLVQTYGVLSTFQYLGAAYLLVTLAASQFVAAPPAGYVPEGWKPSVAQSVSASNDKDWKHMLKDPLFYVLWAMYTIACVSGLMIIGHASPIGQEVIKLDAATAAFAVSLMALANTAGRVLWGLSSDRFGPYPTLIMMFILSAVMMSVLKSIGSFVSFVFVISVIAACFGGFFAIFPSITADLFGTKNLSMNYGILFTSYGVAAFIGPRLAARVKEINNGDYSVAFITAAILCTLAVALTYFARRQSLIRAQK
jgi:OFA family oxalate/formate antiporter-like MFS transporter